MKPVCLTFLWMFTSVGVIFGAIAGLQSYDFFMPLAQAQQSAPEYHALITESNVAGVSTESAETVVEISDARAQLVANFLERHNSPMKPYDYHAQKLVEIADRYGIDFRLLPAIAMQESNLCKVIPENSYNCLGFGVHERGTLRFESYEAAFEMAAKTLKKNYIDIGLTTPEQIMRKYTPSSNGSWAESVNQWMAEMRYDDRGKGRELKENADLLEFVGE